MPQPTYAEVNVVDPVLTGLMVGYMNDDDRFVASRVFPNFPVDDKSGTFYVFTKKYWFTDQMVPRAPGTAFPRSGYGVSSDTYETLQFALAHGIPVEVRNANQAALDLERAGLRWLAAQSNIRKERAWAADFMVTGVWGTDGTIDNKWSDFSQSDPIGDVLTAKDTVDTNTAQMPNTMVIGSIVEKALKNHPDIIDRIKYVDRADPAAVRAALGAMFEVDNFLVGRARYNSANEGQDASMAAIIDDDALLAYVDPSPGEFTPTAGLTFSWLGGGGIGSISQFEDENTDSTVLKSKEQWDQKAIATDVGYFIADVVD